KVAAVIVQVVDLFAVVWQRVPRNLPSGDSTAVSKHGKEKRIYSAAFLKDVEDLFGPFIHERNRSYLDADHFGISGSGGIHQRRHRKRCAGCGSELHEFTAADV